MHDVDLYLHRQTLLRRLENERCRSLPPTDRVAGSHKPARRGLGALLRGFGVSAGSGASR